jgi:hypothetical protein
MSAAKPALSSPVEGASRAGDLSAGSDYWNSASFGLRDYPALFAAADAASRSGRRSHFRLAQFDLVLLLSGGALGAVASELTDVPAQVFRAASAALLVMGLIASSTMRLRRFDGEWFDGRAVAESVKTATWRYMLRATPYDVPDAEAERQFLTSLREMLTARANFRPEVGAQPTTDQQLTPRMQATRAMPFEERRALYLSGRVDDQIAWYAARAAHNRRAEARWFWTSLIAQIVAIGLTIVQIAVQWGPSLVGLFIAIAAAATAWTQLGQHGELSKSYGLAAQELILLKNDVARAHDDAELANAVAGVEDAISRESTMWMAKRK